MGRSKPYAANLTIKRSHFRHSKAFDKSVEIAFQMQHLWSQEMASNLLPYKNHVDN